VRRVRGEGVLRKIIPATPELEGHSRRLLKALEWDGVAHVEFFISNDKKRKWYIETNGRFWASTQGSVSAGWDFPLWIYEYFLHGKKPRPGPLELTSQTCWHLGDLTSLMDYYRGGHSPTPGTEPGKWKAFFQYISGFFPHVHADVFRWKDPLPSLMEHWHFFRRMLERMGRGKQKGDGPGEL
jgi:hypothetical protein